jgi:anti-sigma factor RsiW
MKDERIVGGLSCSQVLDRLSDYLDGDLDAAARAQIEEHLRGCEGCARFGGELAATVRALRAHLLGEVRIPARVQEGLREALAREGAKKP